MWTPLRAFLLDSDLERFAYLLAGAETGRDAAGRRTVVLRARYALPLPDAALTVQTATRVEVSPDVTRLMLRTCYEHALSLIDVHTHPGTSAPATLVQDRVNALESHREFHAAIPPHPPVFAASLVLTDAAVGGMWFDRRTGRLAPLDPLNVADQLDAADNLDVAHPPGAPPTMTRPGSHGAATAEDPPTASATTPWPRVLSQIL
jgi:hypothetical protein